MLFQIHTWSRLPFGCMRSCLNPMKGFRLRGTLLIEAGHRNMLPSIPRPSPCLLPKCWDLLYRERLAHREFLSHLVARFIEQCGWCKATGPGGRSDRSDLTAKKTAIEIERKGKNPRMKKRRRRTESQKNKKRRERKDLTEAPAKAQNNKNHPRHNNNNHKNKNHKNNNNNKNKNKKTTSSQLLGLWFMTS